MAAVLQIRHNPCQLFNLFVIDLAIGVGNGTRTYLDDNPFCLCQFFPFHLLTFLFLLVWDTCVGDPQ